MDKKKREEMVRQEDVALHRGLFWAAGAAVLELLLFYICPRAFEFEASAQGVAQAELMRALLQGMRLVGLAALAGGVVLAVVKARREQNSKWYTVLGVVGLVVMVCGHVALKYQTAGAQMLYLLVPVLGGLALCYYIYQREFFLAALPVVVSVVALWFVRAGGVSAELGATFLGGLVLVCWVLWEKKKGGKAELTVALVSAGAALAVQAVATLAGGMVAYYLIFAMGAWLFALLVYYTVKML